MKTLRLIQKHREEIYAIAEKYGVSEVRVFGSVARGEEKKTSDVDLLVKVKNYSKFCSSFGHDDFDREMEKILHRKVDVVTEKSLHHLLKDEILTTAKPL
jgi:predicted nucleotidyltransferase